MFVSRRIATMGGDKFKDDFSLAFDGTDDYVQLPEKFEYNFFTISAWIKMAAVDTESQAIFSNRGSSNEGFMCYLNAAEKPTFKLEGTTITGNTILSVDRWYHLVWTYNDTTMKIYIDGVLDNSGDHTASDVEGTVNARIGANAYDSHLYPWNGNISEVAVYNTAFNEQKIKQLYNGREPYNHKEGIEKTYLQAWYRMGDGKFDVDDTTVNISISTNSDIKGFVVTNEAITPTISAELYTVSNALANQSNANNITGLLIVEGGSTITSGTAQIEDGGGAGRKSIHIDVSSNGDRIVEDLNDYCDVGKTYRLSCIAKHGGSGDNAEIRLASDTGIVSNTTTIETLQPSETGFAYYGLNFVHTANTRYFGVREIGDNHNQEFYIERLSLREYNSGTGVMNAMTMSDFEGDTP